ncbi:phage tail protein, partial [Enterobacter hormaechei]
FARNSLEGLVDGDPVDIPADQYVSVRVEMPQNSIWNQRVAMAEVPDSSAD